MHTSSTFTARVFSAVSNSWAQSTPPGRRITSAHTSHLIAISLAPSHRTKWLSSGVACEMNNAVLFGSVASGIGT